MVAKKKFKKSKESQPVRQKEQVFEIGYNFPFGSFNSRFFPTLKIILPSMALFLLAILFLMFGGDGLAKVDRVLAESKSANLKTALLPEVAGIKVEPEIKIISKNLTPPTLNSNAVLAQDFDSGTILYQENIYSKLAPASTTKLMTALVAVEHFKAADKLTVPSEAMVGGSTMGLRVGEQLSFRSLLYGMLLDSGNDAAYTIALNYPGGMSSFLVQMNKKSQDLGLNNTHFTNPAGFDDPKHYSSAYDLAKIAKLAALDYQLARIVATKDTQIVSSTNPEASSAGRTREYNLHNLNQLLSEPGVLGMKTGTTEKAGENLVGLVERNGHKAITVMLGSKDRFNETKNLMDWVYANYLWE